MSDKAFLVDTSKCSGCRGCQVACKQWNGLPAEKTEFFMGSEYTNPAKLSAVTWNHVKFFPLDRSNPKKPVWNIMHRKCNHCEESNCTVSCPENAISKKDGWVVIDQSKCIGCGSCESACSYQVPQVSPASHANDMGVNVVVKDKSHKCNACTVQSREIPACASTCPTGALVFGNRSDLIEIAKKRVKEISKDFPGANLYGEKEFGGLRVLTILRDAPSKFGFPTGKDAVQMTMEEADAVKDAYSMLALFSFGIPSLKRAAFRVARSMHGNKDRVS